MAQFTFTGPVSAVYIDLGLEAEPGQTYDLDTAPDGWWTASAPAPQAPQSAPEADSAPSTDSTPSTPTK